MTDTLIYLDYAAATPLEPKVKQAMLPYLDSKFANPSSLYSAAREVRLAIEDARAKVANLLGAKKAEIIWTAGGTESVNLAILGVGRAHPSGGIVTIVIEHEAVLQSVGALEREGHPVTIVPVKPNGVVDVAAIEKVINDDTVLVSVMYANNEIGTIQPIAQIGKLIDKIRSNRVSRKVSQPLYFHTDACQAAGALDLHVSRLGVDLMSLNGSKIGGPKQSGILYVRAGTKLEPLIYGGGQERGLRSGTENVPGIIGFAKVLELAQAQRDDETKRLSGLRDQLWQDIQKAVSDAELNGDHGHRLPNNLNIMIPGIDGETAVLYFDNEGIALSTGSACTTGGTEPSHVLKAIGRSNDEATSSLRVTIGGGTTKAELGKLIRVLPGLVKRLRQLKRGTV